MCVFSIKSDNLKSVGTGCVGNVKREDIEVVELKFSKNNNSSIFATSVACSISRL